MDLPDNVRQLLLMAIDSVAQLEGLLLMRREAKQGWDAAALARRLFTPQAAAQEVLDGLLQRGFLRVDEGRYRYAPASDELRAGVDDLDAAYTRFLIPITNLLHSKRGAAHRFADAFRLGGKK